MICKTRRAEGGRGWIDSLWLLHVQTAPNWSGVCDLCMWSQPTPVTRLLLLASCFFSSSFLPFTLSPLCSCIMWSGWTCIVIRPYGGGRVSESAWRWLNNSKQFPVYGNSIGDKLDLSAVLVSKPDGWLTSNPDMTTQILICSLFWKPFLCILFSFLLLVVFTFLFCFSLSL